METIFLNQSMVVLFVRDDMEQGQWTQEEYSVNATFPYDPNKVIQHGQRIAFRDPATNNLEIFEIRNVNNTEPDHCQQIVAEHIALAELSDEHINTTEITDKTPSQALTTALTGTLWSVGNATATNVSSGDIARGSVWQAVLSIMQNWNVYITPRVTVSTAGLITGRYLDIAPAQGVWRGVRLSIEKNMLDSSVIYDDTEVYTALYGYGGNVNVAHSGSQDTQAELTFADVVWSATSDHPAKPSGQTYLEDPAKTALYGRNGRARFGYYQNADIKDANILLQKTWESLKLLSEPKISISGSVIDLYRLGYKDEPLRLHDKVIVEIKETGETFEKTIIRLVVDLLDPTATVPDIGDYIPNIIYINRDTASKASGGGGGGGGGSGKTELENEQSKYYWEFVNQGDKIGMVVGTYNGVSKILGGEITLAINDDHGTTAKIHADTIDIDGLITALTTKVLYCKDIFVTGEVQTNLITATGNITTTGDMEAEDIVSDSVTTAVLKVGAVGSSHTASWKSASYVKINGMTDSHRYLYAPSGLDPTGGATGRLISSYSDVTIHYLGY